MDKIQARSRLCPYVLSVLESYTQLRDINFESLTTTISISYITSQVIFPSMDEVIPATFRGEVFKVESNWLQSTVDMFLGYHACAPRGFSQNETSTAQIMSAVVTTNTDHGNAATMSTPRGWLHKVCLRSMLFLQINEQIPRCDAIFLDSRPKNWKHLDLLSSYAPEGHKSQTDMSRGVYHNLTESGQRLCRHVHE